MKLFYGVKNIMNKQIMVALSLIAINTFAMENDKLIEVKFVPLPVQPRIRAALIQYRPPRIYPKTPIISCDNPEKDNAQCTKRKKILFKDE